LIRARGIVHRYHADAGTNQPAVNVASQDTYWLRVRGLARLLVPPLAKLQDLSKPG